jgi:signal transduction histidine kinase
MPDQDEGPGLLPRTRPEFRRYSRLSARPTGGEPSTGLGLSIVKKLVLAMHGEVACGAGQRRCSCSACLDIRGFR